MLSTKVVGTHLIIVHYNTEKIYIISLGLSKLDIKIPNSQPDQQVEMPLQSEPKLKHCTASILIRTPNECMWHLICHLGIFPRSTVVCSCLPRTESTFSQEKASFDSIIRTMMMRASSILSTRLPLWVRLWFWSGSYATNLPRNGRRCPYYNG